MAKITWQGEPASQQEEMEWRGHIFKKGEAVEVTDEETIKKAQGIKQFKVEGVEASSKEKTADTTARPQTPPPGQQQPTPTQQPRPPGSTQPGPTPGPSPGQNPQPMAPKK